MEYSLIVSRLNKLYEKLMSGESDANFSFDDLRYLLQRLGFTFRRTKGSHLVE